MVSYNIYIEVGCVDRKLSGWWEWRPRSRERRPPAVSIVWGPHRPTGFRLYEATTRNSPRTDQSVDCSCCRLCEKQGLPFLAFFVPFSFGRIVVCPDSFVSFGSAAPSYRSFPESAYALPPSVLQPLPLVLRQFLEPLRTGLSNQPCRNSLSTPGVVRLGQKV